MLDRFEDDIEDRCPHGVSFDDVCEDCEEEDDYGDDLYPLPPSKAYPKVDIDPDSLPF